MTVNGTNISTFGARQHNVVFSKSDIAGKGEWPKSAALPFFDFIDVGFKNISVDVIVRGNSRADIHNKISNLLALFQEEADVVLDGFSNTYHVVMRSHRESEVSMKRWHKVRLELTGYGYGPAVTAQITSGTTLTINNPGNRRESPCVLQITPRAGVASATITGICRDPFTGADLPVVVKNTTANKVVTIDGLTGLITENNANKAGDVTIWRLPSLKPGSNSIVTSSGSLSLKVTVTPLYI